MIDFARFSRVRRRSLGRILGTRRHAPIRLEELEPRTLLAVTPPATQSPPPNPSASQNAPRQQSPSPLVFASLASNQPNNGPANPFAPVTTPFPAPPALASNRLAPSGAANPFANGFPSSLFTTNLISPLELISPLSLPSPLHSLGLYQGGVYEGSGGGDNRALPLVPVPPAPLTVASASGVDGSTPSTADGQTLPPNDSAPLAEPAISPDSEGSGAGAQVAEPTVAGQTEVFDASAARDAYFAHAFGPPRVADRQGIPQRPYPSEGTRITHPVARALAMALTVGAYGTVDPVRHRSTAEERTVRSERRARATPGG
jgi:hypothetical protein